MPSFVERRASCHRAIDSRASSVDSRAIVSAIDGWIRLEISLKISLTNKLEIRLYICLEIRLAYWSRIIDIDSRYEFICRYFARMTTSLWLHTLVGPSIRNMYIYSVNYRCGVSSRWCPIITTYPLMWSMYMSIGDSRNCWVYYTGLHHFITKQASIDLGTCHTRGQYVHAQ